MKTNTDSTEVPPEFEKCVFLTIPQFAEKLQVAPSTVHEWIASGELVKGIHFMKIKSVSRFPWPAAAEILWKVESEKKLPKPMPKPKPKSKKTNTQDRINLHYGK